MSDPTPAEVRAAIEAQLCPFCRKGPYKVIASHISRKHDVSPLELRDLGGFNATESICSPEASQSYRENSVRRGAVETAINASRKRRSPRRWTQAGLAAATAGRATAAEIQRASTKATRRKLAKQFEDLGAGVEAVGQLAERYGVTRRSMQARLKHAGVEVPDARPAANGRRRRISDEDRAEIGRLYGKGLSQSQIAERFGITQSSVSIILRADGVSTRPFAWPVRDNGATA